MVKIIDSFIVIFYLICLPFLSGITALLAAIWENHADCVRLCLSSGADKDLKTPDGDLNKMHILFQMKY